MKDTKAKDLRSKSIEDLEKMQQEERIAIFKLRRDLVFRQTSDTTAIKTRRHNIARILTVIGEKNRGNA